MTTTQQPLYDISDAKPAHHLRYSWTGWPSNGRFAPCPTQLPETLTEGFNNDGLDLLEHRWTPDLVQLTLSASPTVSPAMLARRVKVRLDHVVRSVNPPLLFTGQLAVKSLGENRRVDVEKFIREQVTRERHVAPGFEQKLKSYTVVNSNVDLAEPNASAQGQYWYNLHLVLVTASRQRISDVSQLCLLRDSCEVIATKKAYSIATLSLMPDHLHVALRGNIEHSPAEIGRCFQNHLSSAVGKRFWADGFYVGSFGEDDVDAVRTRMREHLSRPWRELDGGEPPN